MFNRIPPTQAALSKANNIKSRGGRTLTPDELVDVRAAAAKELASSKNPADTAEKIRAQLVEQSRRPLNASVRGEIDATLKSLGLPGLNPFDLTGTRSAPSPAVAAHCGESGFCA